VKPVALAWIGASFVFDVGAGLWIGNFIAQRTGQGVWVICGLLGGIAVGIAGAVFGFRRALR